jgi:hypothetical protein
MRYMILGENKTYIYNRDNNNQIDLLDQGV